MKILVIGDIHGRRFWKRPLEKYIKKVDKIVFLGDYFDPYQDEGIEYEWQDVLSNFNEILELKRQNPDKIVLLLGNHDMHYRNKQFDEYTRSSRYDYAHSKKIYDLFNGENYKLFQICFAVVNNNKKVIFTHAGITKYWLERCGVEYNDNIEETLNQLEDSAKGVGKLCVIGNRRSWFGEKTGSPVWCDISEFMTDKGIEGNVFQIFGHTRLKPNVMVSMKDFACIDSRAVFILNDKNKLRRVKDEKIKADKEHGTVQDTEDDKP
jgi:predicted phosphodiesterase